MRVKVEFLLPPRGQNIFQIQFSNRLSLILSQTFKRELSVTLFHFLGTSAEDDVTLASAN